jgi:hypothetical protein
VRGGTGVGGEIRTGIGFGTGTGVGRKKRGRMTEEEPLKRGGQRSDENSNQKRNAGGGPRMLCGGFRFRRKPFLA